MSSQELTPTVRSLPTQIATLTLSRIMLNTSFRMMFPLLPVFARAVDTPITAIAGILTLVQLLGLTAPFIGMIAERRGRRVIILGGMASFSAGMLAVFVLPNIYGLAAALLIGAFGKMAFDPAVQAYVGDRVPYERRGLYLGILELGWSAAFLVGVPAMTWLIAQFDWRTPFAALAFLSTIGLIVAFFILDSDQPTTKQYGSRLHLMLGSIDSGKAAAGLVLGLSISAANQLVSVVFGTWIEASFGIILSALAAASAVIGISELIGEGAVLGFSDRFGKRRLVILSILGNIIACIILPFTSFALSTALMGLFFFFLTFETSLVATIPLATELSPNARAMYLTVFVAAVTFGRAIVTPFAPILFQSGLLMNVLVAIIFNLMALIAVWKFIRLK